MPQYKMLLVDLYIEFLRRSCERQRFSYYARMGTLMEKYRETRDESLIEDFKSLFEKELKVKGLWDYDEECDKECDVSFTKSTIDGKDISVKRETYSRLDHFEDCIKAYQGKNDLRMSVRDIEEIEDYFRENYDEDDVITRRDLEKVCKVLKKPIRGNENALLMRINPSALDDISHLEEDLISDFKAFSKEYDALVRDGLVGKKFIYSQSVLLDLLRRRDYDYRMENLTMVKNKSTMKKHNDICRLVFERLGWEI